MHNVKRTPASEAINAAFAAKRNAKLQNFVETKDKIFEKRKREEEFDEILHLTAEILEKNPDIYTFWNIRRFALLSINKLLDESEEELKNRQSNLLEKELELAYKCLKSNPKSYSAWFQRFWVLKRQSSPDLQKELDLCNKALKLDCRNFHCWDHRRLVVKLAEISDQDELKFSNDLIHVNPSNYSAWHYRGMLLIKTQPDSSEYSLPISEDCLKSEFEKIIPLCSYNTEDQTSWTYCRWLSESACPKKKMIPILLTATFISKSDILLVFSSPVLKDEVLSLIAKSFYSEFQIKAISFAKCLHDQYQMCRSWLIQLGSYDTKYIFPLVVDKEKELVFSLEYLNKDLYANENAIKKVYSAESKCESPIAKEVIEKLVDWTYVALLRAIILLYGVNEKTIARGHSLVKKIVELDPQRKNLYYEIWSCVCLCEKLNNSSSGDCLLDKLLNGEHRIDRLNYLSGIITDLDLQNNLITDLKQFNIFIGLHSLVLDENPIKEIDESVYLPHVKFLSLARTNLKEPSAIKSIRTSFPQLERLLLCETALIDKQEEVREIVNPPDAELKIRIFFYYM